MANCGPDNLKLKCEPIAFVVSFHIADESFLVIGWGPCLIVFQPGPEVLVQGMEVPATKMGANICKRFVRYVSRSVAVGHAL